METENPVDAYFSDFIKKLESYPAKKSQRVQEKDWLRCTFGKELQELEETLQRSPQLGQALLLPLSVWIGSERLKVMFRYKLLLRDTPLTESPPMVSIVQIKEETCLPPGVTMNPDSLHGLYWLSPEDREILDKARTLFITARFAITKDVIREFKLPLDLVMAIPAYTAQCEQCFKETIIQPNIEGTRKAYQKHKKELLETYQ
jgi:hypothetical protein